MVATVISVRISVSSDANLELFAFLHDLPKGKARAARMRLLLDRGIMAVSIPVASVTNVKSDQILLPTRNKLADESSARLRAQQPDGHFDDSTLDAINL